MKGKLRNTFLGAFALLAAVLVAAALGDLWSLGTVRSRVSGATELAQLRYLASVQSRLAADLQLALLDFVKTGDDLENKRLHQLLESANKGLAELADMDQQDLQRERIKTVQSLLKQWDFESAQPQVESKKRILELKVGTLTDPAKGKKLMKDIRTLLEEYETAGGEDSREGNQSVAMAFSRMGLLGVVSTLILAAIAAGILLFFLKRIVRPVAGILAWTEALRLGKPFSLEITVKDEIGDLAEAFMRLGEDLKSTKWEFEELLAISDDSPHPIFRLKLNGEVPYYNAAAMVLSENLKIPVPELLPPDMAKNIEAMAGKEVLLRKERTLGDSKYDFIFHVVPGSDAAFVVAFERGAHLPAVPVKKI